MHDFLRFHFADEHSDEQRIDEATAPAIERRERVLVSASNDRQQSRVFARLCRIVPFAGRVASRELHYLVFSRFHAPLSLISRHHIRQPRDFGCKNSQAMSGKIIR
ncbi:MAG TPA: hypothetical protein VFR76_08465, partial [Verrucomicrobiae bacterium]|nr:hypothetical protein [Verrucomicrobiae bacterium]